MSAARPIIQSAITSAILPGGHLLTSPPNMTALHNAIPQVWARDHLAGGLEGGDAVSSSNE
jgi:hypothetical protein